MIAFASSRRVARGARTAERWREERAQPRVAHDVSAHRKRVLTMATRSIEHADFRAPVNREATAPG